jgi:flagellar basal-body rod modification protein FlgD
MSTINTTTTATNTGAAGAITSLATGSNSSTKGVDFNTYLKLLTTQLKNQDPLNPQDGTEFTAQLAQFSSLEQQINSNAYLKKLTENQDYSIQSVATGYLGKEALVPGNKLTKDGPTEDFGFKLDKAATRVNIEIVGSNGQVVRTLDRAGGPAGPYKINWDGKTDTGTDAANGNYTLRITAQNAEGARVTAGLLTYGRVTEVTANGGEIGLVFADGRTSNFADATSVRVPN